MRDILVFSSVGAASGLLATTASAADQTVTFPIGAAAGACTPSDVSVDPGDLGGNGSFESSGSAPSHTYNNAGTYDVGLAYTDDRGQTSPATRHELVIVPASGAGGPGGGGTTGGGAGNGSGAPIQPGAPGSPFPAPTTTAGPAPAGGAQGAGPTTETSGATRLRVGSRVLAFHDDKARIALTGAPRGSAPAP